MFPSKKARSSIGRQWFCEQQELWFSLPPPWMPPPAGHQPSKDQSQPPQGYATPHGKRPPLSLWCVAVVAAKYIGLWGQNTSFLLCAHAHCDHLKIDKNLRETAKIRVHNIIIVEFLISELCDVSWETGICMFYGFQVEVMFSKPCARHHLTSHTQCLCPASCFLHDQYLYKWGLSGFQCGSWILTGESILGRSVAFNRLTVWREEALIAFNSSSINLSGQCHCIPDGIDIDFHWKQLSGSSCVQTPRVTEQIFLGRATSAGRAGFWVAFAVVTSLPLK